MNGASGQSRFKDCIWAGMPLCHWAATGRTLSVELPKRMTAVSCGFNLSTQQLGRTRACEIGPSGDTEIRVRPIPTSRPRKKRLGHRPKRLFSNGISWLLDLGSNQGPTD